MNAKEKTWHDWQQPIGDVERLIECFSKPGDLVVDPCGGGFTTAIACHRLGRCFIGCDSDQAAVVSGQQRLEQERASDFPSDPRLNGQEPTDVRAKLLANLQIWIEDTEDMMQHAQKHDPHDRRNRQRDVRELWTTFSGLDDGQMDVFLKLLPETHKAMWQSLAG